MNPFKAGQQVRCITDTRSYVTEGKTYSVIRTVENDRIVVLDNDGDEGWYPISQFEAAAEPVEIKAGDMVRIVAGKAREGSADGKGTLVEGVVYKVIKADYSIHLEGSNHAGFCYNRDRFELVIPNGVDAKGDPKNLSVADLKPFQRVVVQCGEEAIIARGANGKQYLVFAGSSWCDIHVDSTERYEKPYNIVEVYETSGLMTSAFDVSQKGALVWKKVDVVKEAAKKEADNALAAAKEALAKAEAARAALN